MQIILVIIALSSAVGYLVWQLYKRFVKKESGCDGCGMSKGKLE